MAYLDVDSGDDDTENAVFYNLTAAVGYGQKNFTEDVKVVQFFLNRFYSVPKMQSQKPNGDMTVDGKVGPITRNWIVKTQLIAQSKGNQILVDGIVDPAGNAMGGKWRGGISGTLYTIRLINMFLRTNDSVVYQTLTTNPVVPGDVRLIFQQIQASGPPVSPGTGPSISGPEGL
jgi:hypothetical protein